MNYHILNYHLKKLKRAFLIWMTLISLLIKLWIDNIRFKIFQTKAIQISKVQVKRARWFTDQLVKLGSAFIKSKIRVFQIRKALLNFFKR